MLILLQCHAAKFCHSYQRRNRKNQNAHLQTNILYRCSQPSYNMYNNVAQHSTYYTKTHSVFLATVHDQSVTGHSEVSTCHRDHTSQQMLDFDVKNTVTQHSNMCWDHVIISINQSTHNASYNQLQTAIQTSPFRLSLYATVPHKTQPT